MAKETGLGWTTLSVDNASAALQDIKNDVTNFELSTPMNLQEVTGVDKFAMERLGLLQDINGTLNTVFNPAANRAHAVLGAGDLRVVRTLSLAVTTVELAPEVLFSDYAMTRGAGGELTFSSPFSLADGTVPTWT